MPLLPMAATASPSGVAASSPSPGLSPSRELRAEAKALDSDPGRAGVSGAGTAAGFCGAAEVASLPATSSLAMRAATEEMLPSACLTAAVSSATGASGGLSAEKAGLSAVALSAAGLSPPDAAPPAFSADSAGASAEERSAAPLGGSGRPQAPAGGLAPASLWAAAGGLAPDSLWAASLSAAAAMKPRSGEWEEGRPRGPW